MSKPTKTLLGLITLVPYIFLGLMFINFLTFPQELLTNQLQTTIRISALLWTTGLLAYYAWHLFHGKVLDSEKRLLWSIVLLVGNVFTMPIYWYKHIWHAENEAKIIKNEDGTQIIGL